MSDTTSHDNPSPPPDPGARWVRLGGALSRLSLRWRLILAFAVLIVSSASATIVIGSTVFGSKVDELAGSKVEVNLKVVDLMLHWRLEKMRLLTQTLALRASRSADADEPLPPAFVRAAREEIPYDFLVVRPVQGPPRLVSFSDENAPVTRLLEQPTPRIDAFAARVLERTQGRAAPVLLEPPEDRNLGYPAQTVGRSLILAAAAAAPDGTQVVMGYRLNGTEELVSAIQDLVEKTPRTGCGTTIFEGSTRISSTLVPESLGSQADPEVVREVLNRGEIHLGIAQVVGEPFYTAYMPLRDYAGDIVGMVGIGTSESVYSEVRRNTIALYASLISGGMIFGFLMTYLFSALLVRPVSQLAEGMDRVAGGDLTYKIRIQTADELGRLAKSFNRMVMAVKERDMRLREMTEEELSRVEKQVSIGRLAAGVAHEINNPLTAVLSLSSLILKKLPEGDPRREDLEIVVEETTRCREIVRGLLDYARERPPQKRTLDINAVIREAVALTARYDAMERAEVTLELSPMQLWVSADPKQLLQVFTNLLVNAAESREADTRVRIATSDDNSGGFVVVRVIDNGKGIPPERLKRVFEPFFTTKGTGKGTGLGLPVSLGIVRRHNGDIEIASEPGKGTVVTVTLPREGEILGWWGGGYG